MVGTQKHTFFTITNIYKTVYAFYYYCCLKYYSLSTLTLFILAHEPSLVYY